MFRRKALEDNDHLVQPLTLLLSCTQYVEKGKPLISRRRMKPKETPSSQSEVFGAEHKAGGTQCKNPQQIEERKETVGER